MGGRSVRWGWLGLAVACGGPDERPPRDPGDPTTEVTLEEGAWHGVVTVSSDACSTADAAFPIQAGAPTLTLRDGEAKLAFGDGDVTTCALEAPGDCTPRDFRTYASDGSEARVRIAAQLTVTSATTFTLAEVLTFSCLGTACSLAADPCDVTLEASYGWAEPWFRGDHFAQSGAFAVDAERERIVGWSEGGEARPITVRLDVETPDGDSCAVVLEHDGPLPLVVHASALDPYETRFPGFLAEGWRVGAETTCDADDGDGGTAPWDPLLWGEDPMADLAALPWGLGVGDTAELPDEIPFVVKEFERTPEGLPAGYHSTGTLGNFVGFSPGFLPFTVASTCAFDGDFALDGPCEPLLAEDVDRLLLAGAPPPTGLYRVAPLGGTSLQAFDRDR